MASPVTFPAYLNEPYYQLAANIFYNAFRWDAVTNPLGLQWLEAIYPHAEPHGAEELRAYWGLAEYYPVAPDDTWRAMCYFVPGEAMRRIGAASWSFDWDLVFFINLESIRPPTPLAPPARGRYHARLMQNVIFVVERQVWGFSKKLADARLITDRQIFAELPALDPRYLSAPFAAFRLRYELEMPEACVPFFPFPEN